MKYIRTLLAALVLLTASFTAPAAGVVDNKTGVIFCSAYSSVTFGPDGNVRVNDCAANSIGTAPQLPAAGTLGISPLSSPSLTPGWNSQVSVSRTGGAAGGVSVSVAVTGGCQLGSDHLDWANGDSGTPSVGINTPPGVASCTVSLVSASNGAAINPAAQSITLASAALAKCALPIAPGARTQPYGFGQNTLIDMPSGAVSYGALASPVTASAGAYQSGMVMFESTSTAPGNGDMEISINHCPGAIDVTGGPNGACYSRAGAPNAVQWSERAVSDTQSRSQHICQAAPEDGPWYINVRFNYTNCAWGQCGYVGQLLYRTF